MVRVTDFKFLSQGCQAPNPIGSLGLSVLSPNAIITSKVLSECPASSWRYSNVCFKPIYIIVALILVKSCGVDIILSRSPRIPFTPPIYVLTLALRSTIITINDVSTLILPERS